MQAKKARQLREIWSKSGNNPCKHPTLDKEYFLGAQSGDWVCIICGKNFTPQESDELFANRKKV